MHERKKEKKRDGKNGDPKREVIESLHWRFQSFKRAECESFLENMNHDDEDDDQNGDEARIDTK